MMHAYLEVVQAIINLECHILLSILKMSQTAFVRDALILTIWYACVCKEQILLDALSSKFCYKFQHISKMQ